MGVDEGREESHARAIFGSPRGQHGSAVEYDYQIVYNYRCQEPRERFHFMAQNDSRATTRTGLNDNQQRGDAVVTAHGVAWFIHTLYESERRSRMNAICARLPTYVPSRR